VDINNQLLLSSGPTMGNARATQFGKRRTCQWRDKKDSHDDADDDKSQTLFTSEKVLCSDE
jgi:hypothetical protein